MGGRPGGKDVVDWTVIRDEEGAGGVASAILSAPRSFLGRTSISAAIDYSVDTLPLGPGESEKRVIDISGDGTSNSGRIVTEARDQAVAKGITINGLAIINTAANPGFAYHTHPPGGLPNYYKENVIGGHGAFLLVVQISAPSPTRSRKSSSPRSPACPRRGAIWACLFPPRVGPCISAAGKRLERARSSAGRATDF